MPVTIYEYDINGEVVEEHDENGNVLVEYTREPDGTLISEHRNGVDRFYHYDGAGNTRALTDIHGDVTDTFAYNAFGEVTARTGATPTPYQYHGEQGYYLDSETGDYDVKRRDLSLRDSRWLSKDVMEFIDGTNQYAYVRNNPANLVDSSGMQSTGQCEIIVAGKKDCDGMCLSAIIPIKMTSCKVTSLEYSAGGEACKAALAAGKVLYGLKDLCNRIDGILADWNKEYKDGSKVTIAMCHMCTRCKEIPDSKFSGKKIWSAKDYTISVFVDKLQCSFKFTAELEFDSKDWSVAKCESDK